MKSCLNIIGLNFSVNLYGHLNAKYLLLNFICDFSLLCITSYFSGLNIPYLIPSPVSDLNNFRFSR